ncbi:MAG: Uma2 family endonuclease [Flavobacteriales bacterium]|nr:Uma2 family endonuclease [Flavobacteriales bacterium]
MGFALPSDYRPEHTYEDYCLWEGNWELIDGIPHAMSPAPTAKHQRISGRLHTQFENELSSCSKCEVSLPVDWKISDNTVVQPDLFVACFPFLDKKFIDMAPSLVIEVLSPSTRTKDLTVKRDLYLDQGVKYYVIMDPEAEEYLVLELEGKNYSEVAKGRDGIFEFQFDDCKANVDFSSVWV